MVTLCHCFPSEVSYLRLKLFVLCIDRSTFSSCLYTKRAMGGKKTALNWNAGIAGAQSRSGNYGKMTRSVSIKTHKRIRKKSHSIRSVNETSVCQTRVGGESICRAAPLAANLTLQWTLKFGRLDLSTFFSWLFRKIPH